MNEANDSISDDMLVAFADGEADDTLSMRIEAALETDEALAKRLEVFLATRKLLKQEFEGILRAPVPEHLTQFVMSNGSTGAAVNGADARSTRRVAKGWSLRNWSMAAAVALVAGLGGYFAGNLPRESAPEGNPFGLLALGEPALAKSLASASDGETIHFPARSGNGQIVLRESYKTRQGYCRTFSVSDALVQLSGVACRTGQGWRTEVATAEGDSIGGYAPASGMIKAIDAFLDAAEAEDPLSSEAVRERISAGWK